MEECYAEINLYGRKFLWMGLVKKNSTNSETHTVMIIILIMNYMINAHSMTIPWKILGQQYTNGTRMFTTKQLRLIIMD